MKLVILLALPKGMLNCCNSQILDQAEKIEFAQRAQSELDRVNKLIRQLLDYAGSSSHEMSIVNLRQLFEGICQIVLFKKHNPPISMFSNIPAGYFY